MFMSDFVLALFSAALINILALEPERPDRRRLHALGACSALLMVAALPAGYLLQHELLAALGLQDMRLFLLLPLLAALAWCLPPLVQRLRPDWPIPGLHTVLMGNAAALGLLLELGRDGSSTWQALRWGLIAGAGFWLALLLLAGVLERSQHADIPAPLRGLPITLIGAGIMAMAFSGLNGMFGP